jgi:hypothetical protein
VILVIGNIGRRDRDNKEDTPNRSYRKQLIEVEPLNVYQSTHNYILLVALIFPK